MRRPFPWSTRLLAMMVTALLATTASAQNADPSPFQPALTVNDEPITWYDIDQRMRLLRFTGVRGGDDLQQVATEQLIEDRLKIQAGARVGVSTAEGAGDVLIQTFANNNNTSIERVEAGLRQSGVTRDTLIAALVPEDIWREVIRGRYSRLVEPSEAELDQAVALAAAGRNTEFQIAEIIIPVARRGEVQTRALAQDLAEQLGSGGDFAAAARRYSASASASQGGTIGWVAESGLPPNVAEILAELPVGGVTQPLPVQGALALIKVLDRRRIALEGGDTLSFGVLAISAQDADVVGAIARIDAVIADGPSCETGAALAQEAGLTANRGEPRPLAALPEPVRNAVIDRQVGEVAGPIPVQGGAAAFIICERLEGVPPEVRERMRAQLRQERFQRLANAYLQELRGDAVIEQR